LLSAALRAWISILALAILRNPVQGLRQSLEGKHVRSLRPPRRHALDGGFRTLAHSVDQTILIGGVLDPDAVALGVHRVARTADLDRSFRARLERIAHCDRYFVRHLLR